MNSDTILVTVSDFHSGSNFALFPDRTWKGRKGATHVPNSDQINIRNQFLQFTIGVKTARKGKRVVLVHNGDAIDGDHHHSGDVCTQNELEQSDIHVELMNELQKRIQWQRGDRMYYTRGTETHVHEYENYIGKEMNAVPDGDYFVHDVLELETNGVLCWWAHHGPARGAGPNEGNAVRNWLRNVYYDALNDKRRPPDIVYTGHVHDPTYSSFIYRERMNFKALHGVILPSWQHKTAYAYKKSPVSLNKIGGVWHEIKADGTVTIPRFSVAAS